MKILASIIFFHIFSIWQCTFSQSQNKGYDLIKHIDKNIKLGESFEVEAAIYSDDTTSAKKGGSLGEINVNNLSKKSKRIVKKLKTGQVSKIVTEKDGYYLYKLVDKKENLFNLKMIFIRKEKNG